MRSIVLAAALALTSAWVAAGDADNGRQLIDSKGCVACHGVDGVGIVDSYPNLGGQHERYLSEQLAAFKSKRRDNAIMYPFAAALTPQEMSDIAAYYSSL